MAHDLAPVATWFEEGHWPLMPCGYCGKGHLLANVTICESAASSRLRDHEGWEPEWIAGVFSGVLTCSSPACGEHSAVIGEMKVDAKLTSSRDWHGQYATFLKVEMVSPALPLFQFPDATPTAVRARVSAASSILWTQPSAAANRLRSAVEELLTARGVRKTRIIAPKAGTTSGSKRRRLNTHERIELLRQKEPVIADALEAVKWIGNEGSHDEGLSALDVLSGVRLLERAIELSYDTSAAELARLAAKINKRKGI